PFGQRPARSPRHDRGSAGPAPALWWRRLLPPSALCAVPWRAAPREPQRPPARGLLLPSLGSRSRPAPRGGSFVEIALPPLHQPVADGIKAAPSAARLPL